MRNWQKHSFALFGMITILVRSIYRKYCTYLYVSKYHKEIRRCWTIFSRRPVIHIDRVHLPCLDSSVQQKCCADCDDALLSHDDVIKWKHFPRYWPFVRGIHRSPVNSQHKGQWRGALMFSLICVWINGWVNTREAGDLRRYRAHFDVTVMI